MMSSLQEASSELKRVDHQIYVSLKYTRTVDVLLNIISRMIDAYDFLMDALLKFALAQNLIASIPETPKERCALVKTTFSDDIFQENMRLYTLMRDIRRSNYQKINEYRRHVTLITFIHGKEEVVDIDIITNYYHQQRDFYALIEQRLRAA